jgi:hypothetical protein
MLMTRHVLRQAGCGLQDLGKGHGHQQQAEQPNQAAADPVLRYFVVIEWLHDDLSISCTAHDTRQKYPEFERHMGPLWMFTARSIGTILSSHSLLETSAVESADNGGYKA